MMYNVTPNVDSNKSEAAHIQTTPLMSKPVLFPENDM